MTPPESQPRTTELRAKDEVCSGETEELLAVLEADLRHIRESLSTLDRLRGLLIKHDETGLQACSNRSARRPTPMRPSNPDASGSAGNWPPCWVARPATDPVEAGDGLAAADPRKDRTSRRGPCGPGVSGSSESIAARVCCWRTVPDSTGPFPRGLPARQGPADDLRGCRHGQAGVAEPPDECPVLDSATPDGQEACHAKL